MKKLVAVLAVVFATTLVGHTYPAGLHWDGDCVMQGEGFQFMFVPHDAWLEEVEELGLSQETLTLFVEDIVKELVAQEGGYCQEVSGHVSKSHINTAKSWPVQEHEPEVGWFYGKH